MAAPNNEVGVECIRTLVRNRCATSIRLLAARLWNSSLPGRDERESGLDIVGIDEEGNAIHVVIERKYAAYYRKTLKEGYIYIFSNIGCIPAAHYRPVMRAERLRFNAATKVRHDVDFRGNIKRHHFEFQTYQAAATRLNKDTTLTDLIGAITKIEDPSAGITKLGEGTRSKFYIQDLEGNEFPVNLWGDLSLKFQKLKLLDAKKTTIIIVCATSIRKFEGEIHASSMSPTKFYVNLEIPEVANYLARFEELKIIPEMLSKLSKRSYNVVSAESIEHKSIADLLAGPSQLIKVGQKYNCTATVIGFEVDHGWFYTACTKCIRKVPPPETNMGCQVCNLSPLESMPWYRLETMVEDTSGSTVFTVFGRVGEKLIGAPVSFLVNSPSMDPQCVHPLMDRVVGQSKIFQVTMKENSFGDRSIKFMVQNIFNVENDKPVSNAENLAVTTTVGSSVESSSSSNISKRRLTSDLKQTVEGCIAPLQDKLETIELYAWNQSNQLPTLKCNDFVISEELPSAEKDAGKVGLDIPDCKSLGTTEERLSDDNLLPVLPTLQPPLFDEVDPPNEVQIVDFSDLLNETNPPRKTDEGRSNENSDKILVVPKLDVPRSKDTSCDHEAGDANDDTDFKDDQDDEEDHIPLAELLGNDDIPSSAKVTNRGKIQLKSFAVGTKKASGHCKKENK